MGSPRAPSTFCGRLQAINTTGEMLRTSQALRVALPRLTPKHACRRGPHRNLTAVAAPIAARNIRGARIVECNLVPLNRPVGVVSPLVRGYASDADLPSHIKVNLPALSPTMEMGTIVSWEKKEGDELVEGDLLAEIETDKATMGMETPEEGYLAKILIEAGTKDIPLGKLLCIIVNSKDDIAAFKNYTPSEAAAAPAAAAPAPAAAAPPPPPPPPAAPVAAPAPAAAPGGMVYASPYAKTLAAQKNVDLQAS